MMQKNEPFSSIVSILRDLGGYFVFPDDEGNEFIVISRHNFASGQKAADSETQAQLSLPPSAPTKSADDVLEKINREIALYHLQQQETEEIPEEVDDLALESKPQEKGLRVRFEPLRGDLPPELQE